MSKANSLTMKTNLHGSGVASFTPMLLFCVVVCALMASSCERQNADATPDGLRATPGMVKVDTLRQCLALGTGVLFSNGRYLLSLDTNAIGDANLEWLLDDFGPEATTVAIPDDWCPYPKPNPAVPAQIASYAAGFYDGWRFEMDSVAIRYRSDWRVVQISEMFHGCGLIVRNHTAEYLHGYEDGREVANRVFVEFCRYLLTGEAKGALAPRQPCGCDF